MNLLNFRENSLWNTRVTSQSIHQLQKKSRNNTSLEEERRDLIELKIARINTKHTHRYMHKHNIILSTLVLVFLFSKRALNIFMTIY